MGNLGWDSLTYGDLCDIVGDGVTGSRVSMGWKWRLQLLDAVVGYWVC